MHCNTGNWHLSNVAYGCTQVQQHIAQAELPRPTSYSQLFGCRFLTGSIEEVSKSYGISQSFLGLIVLPIAGNACEHITAVFVAAKDKMVRRRLKAHPVSTDCCSEAFTILTHCN